MQTGTSELARFILSIEPSVNISSGGRLRIGAKQIKSQCLLALHEGMAPDARAKLIDAVPDFAHRISDSSWNDSLASDLFKLLQSKENERRKKDSEVNLEELFFNDKSELPLSDQTLILNIKTRKNSFLYEKATDTVLPYSYEVIKERLEWLMGRKGPEIFCQTNSKDCQVIYEPNRPRLYSEGRLDFFNTWSPAPWAKDWKPYKNGKEPSAPENFLRLLDFVTKNEEDKRHIQAWLRDAIFDRADPILVLCGAPGVGKNLLIEQVAAALVGKEGNFKTAHRGFSRSQFHANVTSCRIFFLDETKLTESARETLKSYHNGMVTIERKFTDVGDPERIHASFALTNNSEASIFFEFPDRKFYAPDLSTTSIEQEIGREKAYAFYNEIVECCGNTEYLQTLANYLYWTFPADSSRYFRKQTETFKRICFQSMPAWLGNMREIYLKRNLNGKKFVCPSREALQGVTKKPLFVEAKAAFEHRARETGERFADAIMNSDGTWSVVFNPDSANDSGSEDSSEDLRL